MKQRQKVVSNRMHITTHTTSVTTISIITNSNYTKNRPGKIAESIVY